MKYRETEYDRKYKAFQERQKKLDAKMAEAKKLGISYGELQERELRKRMKFVEKLSECLAVDRDRTGVEELVLIDYNTMNIKFDTGVAKKVDITADSCLAIMKDVIKAIE